MQEKDVGISKGDINMEEKIVKVLNVMSEYLSIAQMKKLQEVILQTFAENEAEKAEIANDKFLEMFLDAKTIEGCSERTIKYYRETVQHLLSQTETSVRKITTEEIREYCQIIKSSIIAPMSQLIMLEEISQASFHGSRKRIIFLKVLCAGFIR